MLKFLSKKVLLSTETFLKISITLGSKFSTVTHSYKIWMPERRGNCNDLAHPTKQIVTQEIFQSKAKPSYTFSQKTIPKRKKILLRLLERTGFLGKKLFILTIKNPKFLMLPLKNRQAYLEKINFPNENSFFTTIKKQTINYTCPENYFHILSQKH